MPWHGYSVNPRLVSAHAGVPRRRGLPSFVDAVGVARLHSHDFQRGAFFHPAGAADTGCAFDWGASLHGTRVRPVSDATVTVTRCGFGRTTQVAGGADRRVDVADVGTTRQLHVPPAPMDGGPYGHGQTSMNQIKVHATGR